MPTVAMKPAETQVVKLVISCSNSLDGEDTLSIKSPSLLFLRIHCVLCDALRTLLHAGCGTSRACGLVEADILELF